MLLNIDNFEKEIVDTANFDKLIGSLENEWLECKVEPYQINTDRGKRELAKDVSSFANSQGGYILIGIKTKRCSNYFGDKIENIRPFEQNLININQYYNVIESWVYPKIAGITIKWVQVEVHNNKGIIVIKIPKQKDALKPFLITKTLEGKKITEVLFGYSERRRDNNQPLSISDLQKTLKSGFNYENEIKERLNNLEALVKRYIVHYKSITEENDIKKKVESRIKTALEYDDISEKRTIVITAYTAQTSELKTIFDSSENSIRKRLENPPIIRHGGWSLETWDKSKIIRGEMIRVVNGTIKVIDLYRDGTLVFVGLADKEFLAWGNSPKQKINPVAIVELIYNFISFYKLVLEDFLKKPKEIFIRIDFRNMHLDGIKTYLVPYHLNSFIQELDWIKKEAPDNSGVISKGFFVENFDVGEVAFEVLKEIYLWFGIEADKIPYTGTKDGVKVVDPKSIADIK